MFKVLIADDDALMQKALEVMISKEEQAVVAGIVYSGEAAVAFCQKSPVDIIFMDTKMPGISGMEASRRIHVFAPKTAIYMMSSHMSNILIRSVAGESIKDVLEKPVHRDVLRNIFNHYMTEKDDFAREQLEILKKYLQEQDFKGFYTDSSHLVEQIYEEAGAANIDEAGLVKIFEYIGQNLLDSQQFMDMAQRINELFPINESLIGECKITKLWLFRVMDYLFQKNSIHRYPVLENVFLYIDNHIKEEMTLNKIIDNCAISQGYLSRIFREQFQISVMEYLHMKKIHLAKGYFNFTSDSIAEVAFRLGYNESSYFSKVFKKYAGMTVKQYKSNTGKIV